MTTDEFERIVGDYFGGLVEYFDHDGEISRVACRDGVIAEIDRSNIDSTARDGIFFLCDMWAGLSAAHDVSNAWIHEAIRRAREVQIGKLLIDGIWDIGEEA